jgi:hypothetical protein
VDTASAGFFDAGFFNDVENMDQFCCGDSTSPKHGVIVHRAMATAVIRVTSPGTERKPSLPASSSSLAPSLLLDRERERDMSETLHTTADLKQRGWRPKNGEEPAKVEIWHNYNGSGQRFLWRLDQAIRNQAAASVACSARRDAGKHHACDLDVNRPAKRRRDAAEAAYEKGLHGFAGTHKIEKESYYRLKDVGVEWLASRGHLAARRNPRSTNAASTSSCA